MRISAERKSASMYLRFDPCTIVRHCATVRNCATVRYCTIVRNCTIVRYFAARAFTDGEMHRLADLLICAIFPTFNSERVSFEITSPLIGLAGVAVTVVHPRTFLRVGIRA